MDVVYPIQSHYPLSMCKTRRAREESNMVLHTLYGRNGKKDNTEWWKREKCKFVTVDRE